MNTRSLLGSLLLLFAPSLQAISITPECADLGVWSAGGVVGSVHVSGSLAYVSDGRGIALYDLSEPRLPIRVDWQRTRAGSIALTPVDGGAALLTRESLEVWMERDGKLVRVGTTRLNRDYDLIASRGTLVALAGEGAIETFEIRGEDPARLAAIAPESAIRGIAFTGDVLNVATAGLGLVSYDARSLEKIGGLPTSLNRLDADGEILVGAQKNLGFSLFRSTRQGIERLGSARPGHDVVIVSLEGSLLVVSDGAAMTTVWSVADPGSPVQLDSIERGYDVLALSSPLLIGSARDQDRWGVSTGGDFQFVTYEIAAGRADLLSEAGPSQRPATGVDVRGFTAYVARPLLFSVIDFASSTPRELASLRLEYASPRVRLSGEMAILYGGRWVQMVDVSAPREPRLLGAWETLGEPGGSADLAGSYLVEANFASGFHVVNIDDPGNPYQVGGLINGANGQWRKVAGMEGVVYGLTSSNIVVVDIRDPSRPAYAARIPIGSPTEIRADESRDTFAVLDGDELLVFDVSDRYSPELVNRIDVGPAVDLDFGLDAIWVLRADGSVIEVDYPGIDLVSIGFTSPPLSSPRQIGADERGTAVGVADTYDLRLLADPSPGIGWGAGIAPAPRMVTRNQNFAVIEPSSGRGDSTEVMVTTPEGTRTFRTGEERIVVEESGAFEVRVRPTLGCSAPSWSEPLQVEAAPEIFFVSDRTSLVIPAGDTGPLRLAIRNATNASERVTLSSSSSSIVAGVAIDLPPGATTIVDLPVTAAEILGSVEGVVMLEHPGGSDEHYVTLTRVAAGPAQSMPANPGLLLPGIGSTPGARGTRWQSDLHLFCSATDGCQPVVYYRTRETTHALRVPIEAGATVALENLIEDFFGLGDGIGYLAIESAGGLDANAWTYNTSSEGRFGQQIEPVEPLSSGFLTGIEMSERFRTNLGLISPTSATEIVTLQIVDGSAVIGSASIELDPYESAQIPVDALVAIDGPFTGATIRFESTAPVVVYASRVDQVTGDPALLPTQVAGSSQPTAVLDPVGTTPGAENSFWMTELNLTNVSPRLSALVLDLVPSYSDSIHSEEIRLGAFETLATDALLSDYFEGLTTDEAASATLRVKSQEPIALWARVYNVSPNGTFGQVLRPFGAGAGGPEPLERDRPRSLFPVAQSDERRSNLGMAEVAGLSGLVTIRLFDSGGSLLFRTVIPVAGLESFRANGVLAAAGATGLVGARIEIEISGDARITPWVSVVENESGDARYIN